jgi:hypothetical protein
MNGGACYPYFFIWFFIFCNRTVRDQATATSAGSRSRYLHIKLTCRIIIFYFCFYPFYLIYQFLILIFECVPPIRERRRFARLAARRSSERPCSPARTRTATAASAVPATRYTCHSFIFYFFACLQFSPCREVPTSASSAASRSRRRRPRPRRRSSTARRRRRRAPRPLRRRP